MTPPRGGVSRFLVFLWVHIPEPFFSKNVLSFKVNHPNHNLLRPWHSSEHLRQLYLWLWHDLENFQKFGRFLVIFDPPRFLLALVEALRLIMGTNKYCFFRHIFVLNLKGMMRTFLHFCVSYQKWFHLHQKSKFVDFINKNSNFGRNFWIILYFVCTVSYWIRKGKYWISNFEELNMVWMLTHCKLFSYGQVFAKMLEWRYKKSFSFVPFRYHTLQAGT